MNSLSAGHIVSGKEDCIIYEIQREAQTRVQDSYQFIYIGQIYRKNYTINHLSCVSVVKLYT